MNDDIKDFRTLRDFIRYAVSRFTEANLAFGHGTVTAFDEAVFIVLEALRLPIDTLDPFIDARLTETEKSKISALIEARIATRKPASYLLNKAYIQGLPFYVDERVIVPRSFIAEILCADEGFAGLEDIGDVHDILDVCTGSGCLAILAAHLWPEASVSAIDLSADALKVARINVDDHHLQDRVTLFHGDLFRPVRDRKFDLVITNPPYVDAQAMSNLPAEYRHEPDMALDGGHDGLALVRRILDEAANYLTDDGGLICEIGSGRDRLEAEYPHLPFLWLETEHSSGEVFWLTRRQLTSSR